MAAPSRPVGDGGAAERRKAQLEQRGAGLSAATRDPAVLKRTLAVLRKRNRALQQLHRLYRCVHNPPTITSRTSPEPVRWCRQTRPRPRVVYVYWGKFAACCCMPLSTLPDELIRLGRNIQAIQSIDPTGKSSRPLLARQPSAVGANDVAFRTAAASDIRLRQPLCVSSEVWAMWLR